MTLGLLLLCRLDKCIAFAFELGSGHVYPTLDGEFHAKADTLVTLLDWEDAFSRCDCQTHKMCIAYIYTSTVN